MGKPGRFNYFKCALWIGLGGLIGAAAGLLMADPSAPSGAPRVMANQFVMIADTPKSIDGQTIDSISVYPLRLQTRLVTFQLHAADGSSKLAFAFANEPFVTANAMKTVQAAAARQVFTKPDALAIVGAARAAATDADAQPNHCWAGVMPFLDHEKVKHPQLAYKIVPWLTSAERARNGAILGAIGLGLIGSLLFARRSDSDLLAAQLLAEASSTPAPAPPTGPTAEDLQRLAELDAMLTRNLQPSGEAPTQPETVIIQPEPAVAALRTETVEAAPDKPEEEKDYKGEFYPAARGPKKSGFSLVELLVVIGVIGILIALLLPTLMRARRSADTVACAANLHSIGAGMVMYLQSYQNTFPASYIYVGHKIENGIQTPTTPAAGYIHWSSLMYGSGTVPAAAFTCPAMDRGGMPPTNTPADNRNDGQNCPNPDIVDEQAPRLAYTANEVLLPRNKFVAPIQAAVRIYRFVKANEVSHASSVILVTEMIDNQVAISYDDVSVGWIMSHRPINGFVGTNGETRLYFLPPGAGYRKVTRADLDADPMSMTSSNTLLNLVGRNHGPKKSYPDTRLSNFLYVDGHVETKSVYDTVEPFEWGDKFYSLSPNDDLQE